MNQEESEHNEVDGMKKGADSTGEVMHITMTVTGHCDKMWKRFVQYYDLQESEKTVWVWWSRVNTAHHTKSVSHRVGVASWW